MVRREVGVSYRPDDRPRGSSGGSTGAERRGTVELRFHRGGKRPRPALAAGDAGVQFRGTLAANPTANPRGAMEGLGLIR